MTAYFIIGNIDYDIGIAAVQGKLDPQNPDIFIYDHWIHKSRDREEKRQVSVSGCGTNWFLSAEAARPVCEKQRLIAIKRHKAKAKMAAIRAKKQIDYLKSLEIGIVGFPHQP